MSKIYPLSLDSDTFNAFKTELDATCELPSPEPLQLLPADDGFIDVDVVDPDSDYETVDDIDDDYEYDNPEEEE